MPRPHLGEQMKCKIIREKTYVSLITKYIDTVLHLCVHEWCWEWIGDRWVQILTVSSRRVWRDLMKLAEIPSAGYQRANRPMDPDYSKAASPEIMWIYSVTCKESKLQLSMWPLYYRVNRLHLIAVDINGPSLYITRFCEAFIEISETN